MPARPPGGDEAAAAGGRPPAGRLAVLYRRTLPVVLIAAAVAGAGLSAVLPRASRPVARVPQAALVDLVRSHGGSVAHRHLFYLEMAAVIPDGVLVVGPDSWVDARLARGLGGFDVEVADRPLTFDPAPGALGDPDGQFEIRGADNRPYWILDGEADGLAWLGEAPDGYVAVPSSVAPPPEVPGGG